MKRKLLSISVASLLLLQSCVTMSSISISNVKQPSSSNKTVTSSVAGMGVMSLWLPRGLAEKAKNELSQKGVTGNVSAVLTVRNWGVVQFYRVTAEGTTDK